MKQALSLLFRENLASWFRARGFILVLVAALVPAGLTGAWVYTHQGDIAVTDIQWDPEGPVVGDLVNISATVENRFPRDAPGFDVQIRVGFYQQVGEEVRWQGVFNERVRVEGLEAEQETQVEVQWAPRDRDLGTFLIEVLADPDEELRETQRINNFRFAQIQVHSPGTPPAPPAQGGQDGESNGAEDDADAENGDNGENSENSENSEGGNNGDPSGALAQVDLRLVRLDHPPALFVQEEVELGVHVENHGPDDLQGGTLRIIVERERISGSFVDGQVTDVQVDWVEVRNESFTLDIPADGQTEETVGFTPNQVTRFRVHAWVDLEGVAEDPVGQDNEIERTFMVDRREVFEEPPEGMSAKAFYQTLVLDMIHLKLLVPLIALVYAAGVLSDERRRNTLPYLFTRPVPRWALPVVRFAVSFVVAGVAVTVGILAVNAILLGQPGAQLEFLYWPLGLTLGALFVYGAVFTLLGVATQRPYMWGVVYVLGVEFLIFVGRRVLFFNDRPFLQSLVELLSLNHWFLQVFAAWDPDRVAAPWLDSTVSSAWLAGVGLAVIGLGALLASAVLIQKRDFDV